MRCGSNHEFSDARWAIMRKAHNPFLEGLVAFIEGIERNHCPYPQTEPSRPRWFEGWDFGIALPAVGKSSEKDIVPTEENAIQVGGAKR